MNITPITLRDFLTETVSPLPFRALSDFMVGFVPWWQSNEWFPTVSGILIGYQLMKAMLFIQHQLTPEEISGRRTIAAVLAGLTAMISFGAMLWVPVASQCLIDHIGVLAGRPESPNPDYFARYVGHQSDPWVFTDWWQWSGWVLGTSGGVWWWIARHRWLPAAIERIKSRLRQKSQAEQMGPTDIRKVLDLIPKGVKFDPERFFVRGQLFLGLDRKGRPVYLLYPGIGKHRHMVVSGASGCGKGVFVGVYIVQCLRFGEAIYWMDPKDDEWGPDLLRQECEKLRLPFYLVDLRLEHPQLNVLWGCTPAQVEELIVAALGLSDTGNPSDHYRLDDRDGAYRLAYEVFAANPSMTLSDLAEAALSLGLSDGLAMGLRETARHDVLSATKGGADLLEIAEKGGGVYIVGGSEGRLPKMQRMLLIRIQQIAAARDRASSNRRQFTLFFDEVRDLLSPPALAALSKIRDKGMHVIVAHQSLGDFENVPGLSAAQIKGAIVDNCLSYARYGAVDSDTGEWLAKNTGTVLFDDEARQVITNAGLVDQSTGEKIIRQDGRARIDLNTWLAMQYRPGVAVVNGADGPVMIRVSPIRVNKQPRRVVRGMRAPMPPASSANGGIPDDDF